MLISIVELYVPLIVWFDTLPFQVPPFGITVNVYYEERTAGTARI